VFNNWRNALPFWRDTLALIFHAILERAPVARVGCRSKVMAGMNADTGRVITTLPIGGHVDATAFDSESRLVFNSNGEGTITRILQDSADKYSVVENVRTLPKAKTMALDPKTHRLFLSTAEAGQFEVLVVGN